MSRNKTLSSFGKTSYAAKSLDIDNQRADLSGRRVTLEARGAFNFRISVDFNFLNWSQLISHLASIAITYFLAFPIAWDREQQERSAGLRTFPLVAVASCGFILLGKSLFGESPNSQARILQGLITGVGFIGGGAILKENGFVRGLATAASIWNTGAIGAAVAYARYEIALILSLINFATLRWLKPLKQKAQEQNDREKPID